MSAPLSSDPQSPTPLISVIVPLYNVAAYVGACLASLRAQRFEAFEVIVVDDGSSDDSVAQVELVMAEAAIAGDARFRLIRQTHRGLGAARNAGLTLARGAFIAFVDSDDRVTPEYLQQMHQALVESGADWVACAIAFCDTDEGTGERQALHSAIHGQPEQHSSGQIRRCEFGTWGDVIRHFPSAWNKLYRREFIGDIRFPEGTWFEDHGFFARLAARSDHILHLARPLYLQTRGRAGQITATDSDQVFEQFAVLDDLRGVICDPASPHQGGAEAFVQITSRLLFERSTALRDPARRARYVQAAAAYLARHGLTYQPEWDRDISRAFAVEMGGEVPLTVLIACVGQDPASLQAGLGATLTSLARQAALGREVLIACDSRRVARMVRAVAAGHPEVRVIRSNQRGLDPALHKALNQAHGRYLCLLMPGDVLPDQVLHTRVDSALRSGVGAPTARVLSVAPNPEARIYARGDLLAVDLRFELAPLVSAGKPALRQVKTPSPQMLGFPVLQVMGGSGSACFAFEAVFAAYPYANLSFYDHAQRRILFHLSLRQEEGKVVCNHRGPATDDSTGHDSAGLWGREVARRVQLSEAVQRVEVRFSPKSLTTQIAVYVDGQRLFRFGGVGVARRFRDLDQVSYVDFQGGISPAGIDMLGRDPAPLSLNHRLELRGTLTEYQQEPLSVTCAGQAEALAVSPTAILRLPLPGRWWQGVGPDDPLAVELRDGNGAVLATLTLSRADLLSRLEAMLCQADLRADPLAAMQALEHLRFAGTAVQRGLSPKAQERVQALRQFYRLTGFLPPLPTAAPLADPAPHSGPDPVAATQARLIARLRATPEVDPLSLLPAALAELPMDLHPDLYLALVEYFCDPDQDFDRFYAGFAVAGYADHFTPDPTDLWQATSLLPLLLLAGRDREVKEVLWSLTKPEPQRDAGWIVTPALGFLVRRAVAEELPEDLREAILYAMMELVEGLREDLAERAHCLALTEAAVLMITQLHRCPHYMRPHVLGFVIRTYGLSRQFWQRLADQPTALPEELAVIRAAFDQLQEAVERQQGTADLDQGLEAAVDLFTRWDNRDVGRLRRDLFGPAGLPTQGGATPDPAALRCAGLNAEEAMLRHMAFPHGNGEALPDPSAEDTALTARAVTAAYGDVPRAPYYGAQMEAAVGVETLLAQIAAGAEPDRIAASLEALTRDLSQLSAARSHYLGLGLSLGLINALSDQPALLDQALDQLTRLCGRLTDEDQRAVTRATAPSLAARALRAEVPQVIPRLEAMLPDLMAGLMADQSPPVPTSPLPRSPLYDCIVTVFSCQANLETRIPMMRDGWLSQLAARNIPYVVVVGDKDATKATRTGDILTVPAPDDYEGLPQKTLATLRWVQDHVPHAHLLKIDDDCFLNVAEFFHSLSYRKFDYYGRVLQRQVGQMDRGWHMAKSTSLRGGMTLDKSPEPAAYADGGSGYTLSRRAIHAALEAARSPAGQTLIQCSFMEDKLLGDLLSLRGIAPVGEDYRITIRRRMSAEATPVPLWRNSFDPSAAAPVKLVHLDRAADQIPTLKGLSGQQLHPKKIWPTAQPARLGYQSNALELISPAAHLQAARSAAVAVVAVMRNEMFMLPRFLDHYRRLGVTSFLIADNGSDDGTLDYLLAQPDVALFAVDTDYRLSQYGVAWQQAMMAAFRTGKWSLVADADELLVWQHPDDGAQRESLPDLLYQPDFQGAEAARVFMLDMYPRGSLGTADFTTDPFAQAGFVDREPFLTNWAGRGPFSNMPTWTSALRHRLIPGSRADLFVAQKIALLRYQPWMRLSAGLHFVGDVQLSRRELLFGHFKYNADFHRKAAAEVARGQHFNGAEEYRAYLALIAAGRDVLYQPEQSVPWYDAPFVKARLQG